MQIDTENVRKLVRAARNALFVDDILRKIIPAKAVSIPDKIAGDLCDVLFAISGETLEPEEDFATDSKTMRIVKDQHISDEQAALVIEKVAERNKRSGPPKFYSRQEIEQFLETSGGYSAGYGYRPPKDVIDDDVG